MQARMSPTFLLLSLSLFFSTVCCNPNHHQSNHNDFPWQSILSSLGIGIENQTSVVSSTEANGDAIVSSKVHYISESATEILKLGHTEKIETAIITQDGTSVSYNNSGTGYGYTVGVPVGSIVFFILFCYCIFKCCCARCKSERTGVVIMQSNTAQTQQPPPPVPQIILQQPIIHQQAPPMYDLSQRYAQPPPQGPSQWNQPPQWAPQPMGQQQQYSPNSGYDNAGFNPATAPPAYNPGKF